MYSKSQALKDQCMLAILMLSMIILSLWSAPTLITHPMHCTAWVWGALWPNGTFVCNNHDNITTRAHTLCMHIGGGGGTQSTTQSTTCMEASLTSYFLTNMSQSPPKLYAMPTHLLCSPQFCCWMEPWHMRPVVCMSRKHMVLGLPQGMAMIRGR